MNRKAIALLGRRDSPTDAVEDYCAWLGHALAPHGWALELRRVPWPESGWLAALRQLRRESVAWRDGWVLVQYTALGWSRRGFPFGLLAVLKVLAGSGARCAVVFHDSEGYSGARPIDRLRRACQRWVMRRAYDWTTRSIFTVPLEKISWLPRGANKVVCIPVGANLPELPDGAHAEQPTTRPTKTVAVFGVTGGAHVAAEVRDIAQAINGVTRHVTNLRLVVFGRNSLEAGEHLKHALNGRNVHLSVLGLLSAEDVARELSAADVLLFVRGQVSSGRSSVIAGIACGLPVVGYAGSRTGFPVTEAGVALVPRGDTEALSEALRRVLADEAYNRELRRRSKAAWHEYFSWNAIAVLYLEVLERA